MIYIYPEKNLRAYPGVERSSQEWEDTYKIRVNVEKSINHFKDSLVDSFSTTLFCLAIIKGPPNDIYCIIEEPYKHYFTEKVSYSRSFQTAPFDLFSIKNRIFP